MSRDLRQFRRAYIDRTRMCVVVVLNDGDYYLPGRYDPAAQLRKIVAATRIDISLWQKYPPSWIRG